MIEAPELRSSSFEAKANFRSAAMILTQVHDSAILLLAVGEIPKDKPFAQSDWHRESNETTVSTKHQRARGICEWSFVR
jgi:hypothetical protein